MRKISLVLIAMLWVTTASAEGFSIVDSKGKTHRLQDYKGKWVLVNFWATWCPPCLEEMPDLQKLHEKRKDVVVIGIAMEYTDPKYVLSFADDLLVTFPIVLGNAQIAAQIGRIRGLPSTYLFSPQGKLATHHVGALTYQSVERYIEQWNTAARQIPKK